MAVNKLTGTIIAIILALLTVVNTWALVLNSRSYTEKNELFTRITKLETETISKSEFKAILTESLNAQLNAFELRLQSKYHITPKRRTDEYDQ